MTYGLPNTNYTVKGGLANVNTNGSYVNMSCWEFGNCFLTPAPSAWTNNPQFWKIIKAWNGTALNNPLGAFKFNPQNVSAQWANIAAVTQQWYQPLFSGSMDLKTQMPKYVQALDQAGVQQVRTAIQQQLNVYLKQHPQAKRELLSEKAWSNFIP